MFYKQTKTQSATNFIGMSQSSHILSWIFYFNVIDLALLTLAVPDILWVSGDVTLIWSDVIKPIANPQMPPTVNADQNHGSNKWM